MPIKTLMFSTESSCGSKIKHLSLPTALSRDLPSLLVRLPLACPVGGSSFLTAPYEGATYISTVLFNAGYPVRIVDVRYTPNPLRAAYEQIMDGTDVLGICTFEDNFPFCQELMDLVKADRPKMPIICGGSLVTSTPQIFMKHTKCDVAVISEGEITILELMDAYTAGRWDETDLAQIRGIWYRSKEKGLVCHTSPWPNDGPRCLAKHAP